MQKPNLDTTFEKQPVFTDKNGFRISQNTKEENAKLATFGPSSAFGWGVSNDETYTSLVAKELNITPLNASGIGHSILQGEKMWDKLKQEIAPHFAIISYGVNDLDKFRFFDSEPVSDKVFLSQEPFGLSIDKRQLPTNFASSLSLVLRQVEHTMNCEKLVNSAQRVEWNDYKDALDRLIKEMRERKITPVIVNTPFLLKHKNPLFSKALIEKAYKEMKQLANEKKCKEAQEKLKYAKTLEPDNINLSVIDFNKNLNDYCLENKIICIDSWGLLVTQNPDGNFYDPVHPSPKGHALIAEKIIEEIKKP